MKIVTENNTKVKRDGTKTYRYSKKKVEKKSGMNCRPCKKCVIKWQSQKKNLKYRRQDVSRLKGRKLHGIC